MPDEFDKLVDSGKTYEEFQAEPKTFTDKVGQAVTDVVVPKQKDEFDELVDSGQSFEEFQSTPKTIFGKAKKAVTDVLSPHVQDEFDQLVESGQTYEEFTQPSLWEKTKGVVSDVSEFMRPVTQYLPGTVPEEVIKQVPQPKGAIDTEMKPADRPDVDHETMRLMQQDRQETSIYGKKDRFGDPYQPSILEQEKDLEKRLALLRTQAEKEAEKPDHETARLSQYDRGAVDPGHETDRLAQYDRRMVSEMKPFLSIKEGGKNVAYLLGKYAKNRNESIARRYRALGMDKEADRLDAYNATDPVYRNVESLKPKDIGTMKGYKKWVRDVLQTGPQILTQMLATVASPLLGAGFMGAQIQTGTEEKLKAEGVAPERAEKAGFASAGMQSALETVGMGKVLQMIKPVKGLAGKGLNVAKASAAEFVTEWMQKYPELMSEVWARTPGKTLEERYNNFAEGFWDATKEGWYEGSIGAVFGGGPTAVGQMFSAKDTPTGPERLTPEQRQALIDRQMPETDDTVQTEIKPEKQPVMEPGRRITPEPVAEDQRTGIERRIDAETRALIEKQIESKRVRDLSPEEKDAELRYLREQSQELKKEASVDELTGVGTRKAYEKAEKKPAQTMVDVDSLGYINDNYGHKAGDDLLRTVGEAMQNTEIKEDSFRYGGDEFVLQGKDEKSLDTAIQGVNNYLKNNPIQLEMEDGTTETYIPRITYGTGKTFEEADAKLYERKAAAEAAGLRARKGTKPVGIIGEPKGKKSEDQRSLAQPQEIIEQKQTEEAPATEAPKLPPYKTQVKVQETGEVVTLEQDPNQALKDSEDKLHDYRVLKDCIG